MSKPMLVVGVSNAHEVAAMKAQWEKLRPDVEVLFIAGATSMVLIPGDAASDA